MTAPLMGTLENDTCTNITWMLTIRVYGVLLVLHWYVF